MFLKQAANQLHRGTPMRYDTIRHHIKETGWTSNMTTAENVTADQCQRILCHVPRGVDLGVRGRAEEGWCGFIIIVGAVFEIKSHRHHP